ncbi:hypothetical protein K458DRAFT_75636 [Lentithecium fluviatile CBS 122367]|uniref:Uncharacterized protein n=1 Tax=Lentithecium fluviatile CBS 122367 TaxID=1168545 RepID=A0A6G1IUM2_9PLEO|nr:hypothetical protein K458DRAFT_75636 [Lentithecium fluviatile CBS 122367]
MRRCGWGVRGDRRPPLSSVAGFARGDDAGGRGGDPVDNAIALAAMAYVDVRMRLHLNRELMPRRRARSNRVVVSARARQRENTLFFLVLEIRRLGIAVMLSMRESRIWRCWLGLLSISIAFLSLSWPLWVSVGLDWRRQG